jgi:hypothetical protein
MEVLDLATNSNLVAAASQMWQHILCDNCGLKKKIMLTWNYPWD